MARALAGLLFLVAATALAQPKAIYSWFDAEGVEHFTDELGTVPKGVKVRTTTGDDVSRLSVAPLPARPEPVPAAAAPAPAVASEDQWRSAFRTLRYRVKDLEDDVEAGRKRVEEVNGMPVTGRMHCGYGRGQVGGVTGVPGHGTFRGPCVSSREDERNRSKLERDRRDLARAREELADLERRAAFEAVPLEWRR